jgi:hypothetical protein
MYANVQSWATESDKDSAKDHQANFLAKVSAICGQAETEHCPFGASQELDNK